MDKFNLDNKVEFLPINTQIPPPIIPHLLGSHLLGLQMSTPPPKLPQMNCAFSRMPPPPSVIPAGMSYLIAPFVQSQKPSLSSKSFILHENKKSLTNKIEGGDAPDNNREKNKTLIQQTMENVRNVGKVRKNLYILLRLTSKFNFLSLQQQTYLNGESLQYLISRFQKFIRK